MNVVTVPKREEKYISSSGDIILLNNINYYTKKKGHRIPVSYEMKNLTTGKLFNIKTELFETLNLRIYENTEIRTV